MSSDAPRFVTTNDIKAAISGRETEILDALGIEWRKSAGSGHITCPYPEHGGADDWRWDQRKAKAFCTCMNGHADSVLDVLMKCEGLEIDGAKVRAAEMLGRSDLIRTKGTGKTGQRTDAVALLNPPADQADVDLPRAYLANRLRIAAADVLMPSTPVVGWKGLVYWDPPPKQGGKPVEVGRFPCTVFATVAADGKRHAHRIYVEPDGAGKASLGRTEKGADRDPKKSAKVVEGDTSTAGRSVLWGDPFKARWIITCEGIETAAAVAHAFRGEIEADEVAVAATITAGGVEAFQVYPSTERVTVAADRDEARKPSRPEPTRRGERAARTFGMRAHNRTGGVHVDIALPGAPGAAVDWLDVLLDGGEAAVREGIRGAGRFVPTTAELDDAASRAGREAELQRIGETYPLPSLNGPSLFYAFTDAGQIWAHKTIVKGKGDNAEEIDVPVASPFGVTAWLRMADDEDAFGLRMVVQDPRGMPRTIDIDRGQLATMGGVEARKLFLSNGVLFEGAGMQDAVAGLIGANPEAQIAIVRHPGFHDVDGVRVYVAPGGEIIGLPEGRSLELSAGAVLPPTVARGGTFEGWKDAARAALEATDCPHFALGLAAGFAGVLVDLCGLDSCGINLSGQTSSGKTTSQRLSTSPWSVPDSTKPGLFQVAKTTVNGFEFLAVRANGTVFTLDELAHLTGRETAKVIYTLASGIGKARMTPTSGMREPHRWRTFAILSSETSLEAKITADGETWTGGQAVRIADVDVTGINRLLSAAAFAKIASVGQNYGHAGPAFVRALMRANHHNRVADLRDGINTVARTLAGPGADAAQIRAAMPLAILSTAGRLAQMFGILPSGPEIANAVHWAWHKGQGADDATALDPAAQALTNIRQWVAERWNVSIHWLNAEGRPSREASGWWDDEAVYLPPNRLFEAAGGAIKEELIVKNLSDAGMIAKTKDPKHLYVSYVPKVGPVKAYALSRAEFGRSGGETRSQTSAGNYDEAARLSF
ncbi:MAG: DUF927 domain-containing protein [Janthinobacterium lividum]